MRRFSEIFVPMVIGMLWGPYFVNRCKIIVIVDIPNIVNLDTVLRLD